MLLQSTSCQIHPVRCTKFIDIPGQGQIAADIMKYIHGQCQNAADIMYLLTRAFWCNQQPLAILQEYAESWLWQNYALLNSVIEIKLSYVKLCLKLTIQVCTHTIWEL